MLCIAAEEVFQICIEESLAVEENDKKMEYSVATGVSYIINSHSIFLNILQIKMPRLKRLVREVSHKPATSQAPT